MTPARGVEPASPLARRGEWLLGWVLGSGLLLLVVAQSPSFSWQAYVVPKLVVLSSLTASLLLVLAVVLAASRPRGVGIGWPALAGAAFVAWSAVAGALGANPGASVFGAVYRYEGVLGFAAYLVVFVAARRLASARFIPGRPAVFVGAAVVGATGLLGVVQHVWPFGSPVEGLSLLHLERSQATFANPIVLGLMGCLCVPVLLALVSEETSRRERSVLTVAVALAAAGAFLSYSRAFWLFAPLGCLAALVLAGPPRVARWRSILPAVVLAVLCVVIAVQVGGREIVPGGAADGGASADEVVPAAQDVSVSGRVGETFSGGGSIRSRVELYKGALTLISERPALGWGLETYVPQAARTRTETLVRLESHLAYADRPHNSLLYVAYSTGLPGLGLFLLFVGGSFAQAVGGYRRRRGRGRTVAAGLIGGLVAYMLAEQTVFSTIEVTPLFFAMLGWASASTPGRHGDVRDGSRWRRGVVLPPRAVVALSAGAAMLAVAWGVVALPHAVEVMAADHVHHRLVEDPPSIAGYGSAVADELEAARRDPYNPYLWNTAALMLATAAEQLGRPEELRRAQEVLEEGLGHLPDEPTLVISLSDVLYRQGRPSEVVALLEPYLARDRYQADGLYNLGLAYLALGQAVEAADALEEAVRLDPQDADCHWSLGEAYRALGRAADAEREQETAASLDPEYADGVEGGVE